LITMLVLVSDFLMVLATGRPPALPDGIAVGVPAPAAVPVGQAAVLAGALVVDAPLDELLPPEEQATRASPAAREIVTAAPPLRRPARAFLRDTGFSACMSSSPTDTRHQTEI
jgi:hypothetical protein